MQAKGTQQSDIFIFVITFCFIFWNSHWDICLQVGAILNPGSGGWWWWGALPTKKKRERAQSGVFKTNPNKQCWLLSGRYCRVSLHQRHRKIPQDMSPESQSQTSPVILHESQSRYQRKLNASAKARMRWQMRTLLPAGGSELWWNGKCWELLQNNSWKAFCGLESDLRVTATVSLWHLAVKLKNTQSSESLDETQILKAIAAANSNQKESLKLIPAVVIIIISCWKKKDEICQTLEKILNKQKRHIKSIITDWKTLWKTPSTAAAFLIMQ